MDYSSFQQEILSELNGIELRTNELMSRHTSFKIGGAAEVMAFPRNTDELTKILKLSKLMDISPRILGAGTNVLAPDDGLPGLVICLKDCFSGMECISDHEISVMAGVTMARAAVFAAKNGLSGMEFAHGIPGTIGGGVYMNAGAYGGEISQICTSATVMDMDGCIREMSNSELQFSYRHSVLEDSKEIVVSAVFSLNHGDPEKIYSRMKELIEKRSASQPLDLPSAGSAFKRPVGGYAAALIDSAGLKGYRVGNAAISTKHAGFAVNLGGASASNVKRLLTDVSEKVFETSGITLEPEIRIW